MENSKNPESYRLNWQTIRNDWPLWLIIAAMLVGAILVFPHLPDKVAGHWNIKGEVDAYYPRSFGAFFPPLMALGLYLMMLVVPLIDPRRENYSRFAGAYAFMRWALVLFSSVLWAVTILVALGYPLNIPLVVKFLVALLLIIIGNFMGQFRHNYFVGIKTPWTLANEEVWQRTHRLGGKIWVVGGLLCLGSSLFQSTWAAAVFLVTIFIMTLVPIIYSYLLFTKLEQ